MYVLFEIPDIVIIAVVLIIILIVATIAIIIKVRGRKVKPIAENERYDSAGETLEVHKIEEDELTSEQKKAKEELEKVFSKMSEDLEKQNKEKDEIEAFEKEQEENAIISYQELIAQAEKLKKEAQDYEKLAESKAPTNVRKAIEKVSKNERPKENKKSFKSSDIVSPIYGVQSNKNMVKQKKSSNAAKRGIISEAYEKKQFEEEKTQNLDFLNSLKEFRKNL